MAPVWYTYSLIFCILTDNSTIDLPTKTKVIESRIKLSSLENFPQLHNLKSRIIVSKFYAFYLHCSYESQYFFNYVKS